MSVHVLTGTDARALRQARDQLTLGRGTVETFDISDDHGEAFALAATTPSLFFGDRVLVATPASDLSAAAAARITTSRADGVTVLLCSDTPLPAAVRASLSEATWHSFTKPTGKDAGYRVREYAASLGLTLAADAAQVLTELAPSRWDRVCGALDQVAQIGATTATIEDLAPYIGTAAARAVPWALTDALCAGNLSTALAVCAALDPIPAVSYLAKVTADAGLIVDGTAGTSRAGVLARRLGADGVARTWDLVAAADRAVKVDRDPASVLVVLVTRLAPLWAPPAT